MSAPSQTLRLGTRGSALAVAQSQLVASELMRAHNSLRIELVTIKTTGDIVLDRPLYEVGGKGVFTKEIEVLLLRGEIDFAVHSLKDMPVTMPLVDQSELVIAATPPREDVADVLISSQAKSIDALPHNARVGSSSLRRRAQLLDRRPDLRVEPIRGNIDTRVQKLKSGEFDAIILAAAGLRRLAIWDDAIMARIDELQMLPAAGQGALALQCRADDAGTRTVLAAMDDATTRICVEMERAIVRELNGDCHSPIAAWARQLADGRFELQTAVATRGGAAPIIREVLVGGLDVATAVAERLKRSGAMKMLHVPSPGTPGEGQGEGSFSSD